MGMLWKVLAAAAVAAAASLDGLRAPREVQRSAATPRYVLYLDQYHTTSFPSKDATSGINYVITAFANSSLFTTSPPGNYTPFMPLAKVRSMFDDGTKVCMAIGGWADNAGFDLAARNDTTRKLFSKNIATTLDRLGYDCVDIDWEYPAGNGADYRQIPNSKKAYEIEAYPKLLKDIKKAIGCKELSIAVPGLERDMIAYTHTKVPKINEAVDFVNVMTYDLMNRRDNVTRHHTSVAGSLQAIDLYIQRGFPPSKLNLGFAFYAKYFTTAANVTCNQPVGCPTALLEAADGSDTGLSSAMTFEAVNFAEPPTNLTVSPDGSCGPGTFHMCGEGLCCSQYGFCGNTPAHCNAGCNVGYGRCDGVSTAQSFRTAMKNGKTDDVQGGQWYWDAAAKLFWTWDTPELMARKFNDIVKTRGLGGVMAWSLAEDSFGNWPHLAAMKQGVEKMKGGHY